MNVRTFFTSGFWALAGVAAAQQYSVVDLGAIPGSGGFVFSSGSGINSSGEATGINAISSATNQAFFYSTATGMQNIGNFSSNPTAYSQGNAINDSGMIAGVGTQSNGNYQAFSWTSGGGLHALPFLSGGNSSIAYDINNAGEIVGVSSSSTSSEQSTIWVNGVATDIGGITGASDPGYASSVNASGQVAGTSIVVANSYAHAYVYTPGQGFIQIGDFGGGNSDSVAESLNSLGDAVGYTYSGGSNDSGTQVAFYWSPGTGEINLGFLAGSVGTPYAIAQGVNSSNVVVGYGSSALGGEAFSWTQANGMRTLDSQLTSNSFAHWEVTSAQGINDNGDIIAIGFEKGVGVYHAVELIPTPEPPVWLAATGFLYLLAVKRRNRS